MRKLLLSVVGVLAVGCNCEVVAPPDAGSPPGDAGHEGDDAAVDGGVDAGPDDGGGRDAGAPDAGALDGGGADPCQPNPCLGGGACTRGDAGLAISCSPCAADAGCPQLRAQAGPDQVVVATSAATLEGMAVGFNGAYRCVWSTAQDTIVATTCQATVTPTQDTVYVLTVLDATGAQANDSVVVRLAALIANAGPDLNVVSGGSVTLRAGWSGASCADAGCIQCDWRRSDGGPVSSSCAASVSPADTTGYFLTVSDTAAGTSARDNATVFVTDRRAQLCAWNVVVLTSNEYPSAPNPVFTCDDAGVTRRQAANGKPAIVLSDLEVSEVRITGYLSVETSNDDDLIGFLWGWQSPKNAYLLSWKKLSQNWTAACGSAPIGMAVKKLDGAPTAASGISFNPAFGFNATDYVYSCADLWSQSRANAALLKDQTTFLLAPADLGAPLVGWTPFITYRFEFYYTASRTRILVYEDDTRSGATDRLVANLLIEDSSYPSGAFAFFSNSQEQVQYGDFSLASLLDYRADAGADVAISNGQQVTLAGSAVLAVPPYRCHWSWVDGGSSGDCSFVAAPLSDTVYQLTVTDDLGRLAHDEVSVVVGP